jgi:hypothetical protein
MTSNRNRADSNGSDSSNDVFVGSFVKNAFEEVRVACGTTTDTTLSKSVSGCTDATPCTGPVGAS